MDVAPYANKLVEYFTIRRWLITEHELLNELSDASEEYFIVNEMFKSCSITKQQRYCLLARIPKLLKNMLKDARNQHCETMDSTLVLVVLLCEINACVHK